MASAAAAKKWPRLFQCGSDSPDSRPGLATRRRYASWTSAVTWSICPGFSWASFAAASLRNSS